MKLLRLTREERKLCFERPSAYFLDQLGVAVSLKRHGGIDHGVQHHTQRPHVHLWPAVRPPVDDLWGGVERTSTEGLQIFFTIEEVGETKVCNL